eukprot:CAMPEP_0178721066 /NCGR_PEP_ID=MMETSP0699-20121125/24101_1 /TAXON_ID=265572 /ORGANISM="Extubocellulus spinifer, Strain CCMP396" /LENGTH=96 /DNA_ID=CAMNT_0020371627 /DNA_START=959 /DNA_END=1246 /DNA_ORIENTATION=-
MTSYLIAEAKNPSRIPSKRREKPHLIVLAIDLRTNNVYAGYESKKASPPPIKALIASRNADFEERFSDDLWARPASFTAAGFDEAYANMASCNVTL